ncbi:MAG: glycosyltransferase [Acidobacteriota bacterium]
MRIAFAGNQNNYPFMLARALRRAGHQVLFIVDRPEALNRPEARYPDLRAGYPEWIETAEPLTIDDVVFRTPRWTRLLARLATADAVVLNGWTFAAAADLDQPAICLATGSDLEFYANRRAAGRYARNQDLQPRERTWVGTTLHLASIDAPALLDLAGRLPAPAHYAWRWFVFRAFVARQRAGFARARAVAYLPTGTVPVGDRLISELRPGDAPLTLLMTDTDALQPAPLPVNARLRVFNSARLDWRRPFPPMVADWENKGGDVLLRGIALFTARTGTGIDLHLVAKGQSVDATRALAAALGLESSITWHGEMSQHDVFEQYRLADVVADQLGGHMPGLSTFDAMALGRPVLANGRPDSLGPALGAALPVAQASTPEEVARQLERLTRLVERRRLALKARVFAERHLSSDLAAARVIAALTSAASERAARAA